MPYPAEVVAALRALRSRGLCCLPYGTRKLLVPEGPDLVVVPVHRVHEYIALRCNS